MVRIGDDRDSTYKSDNVVGLTFRREEELPVTICRPIVPPSVLIVEDSACAADAYSLLLRSIGARVRWADSLRAANRHLRSFAPNTVLVDPGLPDGNGLRLIRRLWLMGASRPRLIVVSGDNEIARDSLAAGADHFLEKPLSAATFLAEILTRTGRDAPSLQSQMPMASSALLRRDLQEARIHILKAVLSGREGQLLYPLQFLRSLARDGGLTPLSLLLDRFQSGVDSARDLAMGLADMIDRMGDENLTARQV
ncbi:response regulator [Pontibrevibacter nitratireducens]|uniref:Response regulator n=2 Tax=Pontivivens nitratireducens TaxID=2758038 RepID=A0A6G7VL67_9RHOB|nr:response regulator [Pontibrevibacter nitratireducens]